jgi:hypothetical protein
LSRNIIFALGFVVLAASRVSAEDEVGNSEWFPTAVGMTWTYRVPDGKITVKVAKHEKQSGMMCARFETLDKGEVVAVQHVALTADKVLRVAHNGEKVEPPLQLLMLPAMKGQIWNADSKMTNRTGTDAIQGTCKTDEEDVKVPAGDFKKAIRVTAEITIDGKTTTIRSWYAPKVGLVKQRIINGTQIHEMDLEKVDLPK